MAATIPEKFFGSFKLDRSENFDEFLSAKGVNWFLRKMIQFAGVTKVIAKGEKEGTYNMENLTSKKNTLYHGWKLGEEFEAEGLDSTKHNVTFNIDGDVLSEKHVRLETPDKNTETYFYTIEGNELVLKMDHNNIVCRRWFKRENK